MHIIYGLRNDYEGDVRLDNLSVRQIRRAQWADWRQRKLAIVFQDLRLFSDLTAWENIQLKAILTRHSQKEQIMEMAEHLGIANLMSRKAGLLSYGEKQRVAIIRALVQPFECLLLDEPFSHLDEANIRKGCELIEQKRQENQASLIMTSLGYPYYIDFDHRFIL
ncbi:MAG: ATP-binding cassette domain-containing protein [Bacteroidia bacterium]|nr:ATP-binding cassette domain-containing protein [Bacteroidia bacterium]